MGLGRDRDIFVGVGWDRGENPSPCHPLILTESKQHISLYKLYRLNGLCLYVFGQCEMSMIAVIVSDVIQCIVKKLCQVDRNL